MKKRFSFVVLFLFSVASIFAYQNVYQGDSLEYELLMRMVRLTETQIPVPTTGVSGEQMSSLLDALDIKGLNAAETRLYERLVALVKQPDILVMSRGHIGFDPRLTATVQGFANANRDANWFDWSIQRKDRKSVFIIGADMYFNDLAFGRVDIDQTKLFDDYSYHGFELNFAKFGDDDAILGRFDLYRPKTEFLSLGSESFNFQIGRTRAFYPKGHTGSMGLGDNFLFHDMAKVSLVGDLMSYDLTLMAFDSNAPTGDAGSAKHETNLTDYDYHSPSQYLTIHRFSFVPFRRLAVTLYEGMIVYAVNPLQDPRFLSPFIVLHNINTFEQGNANNYFGFELDYIPCKGLELHLDAMVDQVQAFFELDESDDVLCPNAFGILANATYSMEYQGGILDLFIEGAYASPALYLKETKSKYADPKFPVDHHDYDLIVGNSISTHGVNYSYLGYRYGCDTIVGSLGASWLDGSGLSFGGSALFRAHGIQGIAYEGMGNQTSHIKPGREHFNDVSPTSDSTTKPEYRMVVEADAVVPLRKGIEVSGNLCFVQIWNHLNIPGKSFTDVQLMIECRINATELLFADKRIGE